MFKIGLKFFPATDLKQAINFEQLTNIPFHPNINYAVHYVKTTPGAPTGTAADGEYCLNTNEAKLYSYSSGWDAGTAVTNGQKFINKSDGSDTSGNSGTYTKNNKIYSYISGEFTEFTPVGGSFAPMVQNEEINIYMFVPSSSQWMNLASDPPTFSPVQILPDDFTPGEKEIWNLLSDTWLKKAVVVVSTEFDNGAKITLGFDGDETAIASSFDIDLTTLGIYVIPDIYRQSIGDELFKAFLSATSTPTLGSAFVFIEQS